MECLVQDEPLCSSQNNVTLISPDLIKTEEDHPEFVNVQDLLIHNIEQDNQEDNDKNNESAFKRKHYCAQCGEEFPDVKYVQIHQAVHGSKLHCPACDKIFKLGRHFVLHVEKHLKKPIICQHCPEIFFDKRSYNLHLYSHRKIKTYTCEYCLKEWTNKKDLQVHIRVHTNERPYSCEVCGKSFKQRGGLSAHVNTLHSDRKNLVRVKYPCEICNGSYATVSSLNKHIRKIHETGKTFPCKSCGKTFLNFMQMKQHRIDAHPEHIYIRICPICGREFASRDGFTKHQRTHTESEQEQVKRDFAIRIVCYLCGEELPGRNVFSKHQQVAHLLFTDDELKECTKAKQFNCKICGKVFALKKNLFRHMDSHSEKTFECSVHCTEKFTYLGIRIHLAWHFDQFHCSECDETFVGKKNLKKHCRNHHTRVKFTCKICGHNFRHRQLLITHWKTQHNLKCHLCLKKFVTHLALKQHAKIKHKVVCESSLHVRKVPSPPKVALETSKSAAKYDCKICERSLNTMSLLRDHMKSHRKKYFQCDNCKRNFLYRRNLMFHVKHNICLKYYDNKRGMKQFSCILCEKECSAFESLMGHMRLHADLLKCKFCNSKFKHMDLREHINRVHPGEVTFCCDNCGMCFWSVDDLLKHNKYNHEETIIKTELEDATDHPPDVECDISIEENEDILHDFDQDGKEHLDWIKEEPEEGLRVYNFS